MSTSIFFDPPILARRVYAGEVRVVDDIKFWNKITKVVYSRIHSDDNNLNFQVEDATKEINFYTNQITFHDGDGDQLGYIDASGTIHGLTIDGHATEGDFGDLEDRVEVLEDDMTSNASRISVVETDISVVEADLASNASRISVVETDISVVETDLASNASRISVLETDLGVVETDLASNASRISVVETDLASNAARISVVETDLASNAARVDVLETDLSSNAARVDVLETDLASNAARIDVLETDLASNAARVDVLETDLSSNAARVDVLETDLSSNAARVDVLETDLASNAARIDVVETDLASNAARIDVVETDLASNAARIDVVETDLASNAARIDVVETDLASNASRISVVETDLASNAARIDVVETDLASNAARIDVVETDLASNAARVDVVETDLASNAARVDVLETDLASSVSRIATIEGDYVTTSELVTATASTAAGAGFLTASSVIYSSFNNATQTTTSKTLGDHFDELEDLYNANEQFNMETFVQKPTDWSSVPLPQGTTESNLKLYTQWKVDRLKEGRGYGTTDDNSYLKVRDTSVNFGGNRIGTPKIEFLRTTVSEAFGTDEAPDWRLSTDSLGNFDVYRKATHPSLGVVYDGNVIEFKVDGDINVKKAGGLYIDDEEVATVQEVTDQVAPVDQTASQLVTLTNGHGTRITDLENAGYVTSTSLTNTLSTYALQSALGTTNTTVNNIDTRLVTVENAGYVTASGLSGYNFATQGYVQTAVADLATESYVDTAVTDLATESYVDTAVTDLATESYVDTAVTDLATESYVDTAVAGVSGSGSILNSSGHLDLTSGYNQDTTNKSSMIMFNGGSSSSNKDTIYFDDGTNRYHFTKDTTKYAEGNAGITCGDLTLTTGSIKLIDSSTPDGRFIGYYEDDGTTQIGYMGQGSSGNSDLYMWGRAGNSLRFGAGNAERIMVEAGGNVGINTTSPLGKLHVSGGAGDCVVVIQADTNNSGESDNPTLLFIQDGTYRTSEIGNDTNNGMVYRSYGDQIWYSSSVHSNTSNFALKDNQTERMRLTNSGNVGVGTASPAQKLDVAGRIRADTMEIDSYIYHVGDTNTYFGFSGNDHFQIVEGGGTRLMVDSTGDIGVGRTAPKKKLDVAGTVGCAELFYGDTYTGYEQSYLTCTKSRRSTGHPIIAFTINAATQVGWIPYTFQLYGSGVNSNGGSHFQRIGEGHGRYYNGSNSTSGVSGVTFTASQSGSRATLTWNMDDVGRNYTIFTCTLTCYEGIIS